MFKQTETKLKNVKLGFGDGSIYDYGCYLVSLCNGLNQKGYSFTPESLNDLLKTKNAWIGEFRNYIDVANLDNYLPDIFGGEFQQIEPWNDVPSTQDLLKNDLVVVCKVNAVGIGGVGTHFVLLVGIDGKVAVIHDPYTGKTEKVTVRYGKLGNILGLRIFKVRPYTKPVVKPMIEREQVIKEIYNALCGEHSQGEVDWRMGQEASIESIVGDVCQNDKRFKDKWIPAPVIVNVPVIEYVEKPIYTTDDRIEKLKEIKNSKNWWWVKYSQIMALLA